MSKPKRKPSIKLQVLFTFIAVIALLIMIAAPLGILLLVGIDFASPENEWWVLALVYVGVMALGLIPIVKLAKRWGIKWE